MRWHVCHAAIASLIPMVTQICKLKYRPRIFTLDSDPVKVVPSGGAPSRTDVVRNGAERLDSRCYYW